MKQHTKNILFYSLTSLAVMSLLNTAHADEAMTVPRLANGMTVSLGTFYAIGSADNQDYAGSLTMDEVDNTLQALDPVNNSGDYDFGIEASLGYIFNNTANGVELSYRGLNSSSHDSTTGILTINDTVSTRSAPLEADNKLEYNYDDADLLLTQYLNLGRRMQARLAAGVAYLSLKQEQKTDYIMPSNKDGVPDATVTQKNTSEYSGVGPRLGFDARYAIGNGFGFLGGLSAAFFLGSMDLETEFFVDGDGMIESSNQTDDIDNQDVLNVSGNLAVDYVYVTNKGRSSVGLELGYRMDYYDGAVGDISGVSSVAAAGGDVTPAADSAVRASAYGVDFYAASFSGPYIDIKAAF